MYLQVIFQTYITFQIPRVSTDKYLDSSCLFSVLGLGGRWFLHIYAPIMRSQIDLDIGALLSFFVLHCYLIHYEDYLLHRIYMILIGGLTLFAAILDGI
jgi:hypothetical protein